MKHASLIIAAGLTLAGPAIAQQSQFAQAPYPDAPGYGQPYDPQPDNRRGGRGPQRTEAVYAVEAAREAVRIRVSSNGCTRKQDFQARRNGGRESAEITFVRVRQDNCRSFAVGGVWLTFDNRELGLRRGGSFTLGNPLTPWIGPGRG
jgi:hypothetical protein